MNLHEVSARCAGIARGKGFDECTWENLPVKLMLIVTEFDEACEAGYEAGTVFHSDDGRRASGTGLEVSKKLSGELADVAIRTMVLLETLWPDWSEGRILSRRDVHLPHYDRLEVMLWPLLRYARKAVECWRMEEKRDAQQCLELMLLELWRLADRLQVHLEAAILEKIEKNILRPKLNGKLRTEG